MQPPTQYTTAAINPLLSLARVKRRREGVKYIMPKTLTGPNACVRTVGHAAEVRTSKKYAQSFACPTNEIVGFDRSRSHNNDMSVDFRSGFVGHGEPSTYSRINFLPRKY